MGPQDKDDIFKYVPRGFHFAIVRISYVPSGSTDDDERNNTFAELTIFWLNSIRLKHFFFSLGVIRTKEPMSVINSHRKKYYHLGSLSDSKVINFASVAT